MTASPWRARRSRSPANSPGVCTPSHHVLVHSSSLRVRAAVVQATDGLDNDGEVRVTFFVCARASGPGRGLVERARGSRAGSRALGSASVGDVSGDDWTCATRRPTRRYLDGCKMMNDGPEVDLCRAGFDPRPGRIENTVYGCTTCSCEHSMYTARLCCARPPRTCAPPTRTGLRATSTCGMPSCADDALLSAAQLQDVRPRRARASARL